MAAINPRRIPGNWRQGYVLDFHTLSSEFLGYDEYGRPQLETKQTEIGELLYRLKYKADHSAFTSLVETAAQFLASRRLALDYVLPRSAFKTKSLSAGFGNCQSGEQAIECALSR